MTIAQPKRTRAEVPWRPPYRYVCGAGHTVEADHPVSRCPAAPLGQPCEAVLQQTAGKSSA